MACYRPLTGYMSADPNNKQIKFNPSKGYYDKPLHVPCGHCIGCLEARSREWALRCQNESQMNIYNCFITLTYNDDHLPDYGSLDPRDLQLFFKRLRKHIDNIATNLSKSLISSIKPHPIKYFASGEYGSIGNRPHYHACIFGWKPIDMKPWKEKNGYVWYRSQELEQLWSKDGLPIGFATIGDVTFQSAAYTARYCLKKLSRQGRQLESVDLETGEIINLYPEFSYMSRGSRTRTGFQGIGAAWIARYMQDCRKDYLIIDGYRHPIPRYYRDIIKKYDTETYEKNRQKRRDYALTHIEEFYPERQKSKQIIKNAQMGMLKGSL